MIQFIKKFFIKNQNICAAIDIWSSVVKTIIFENLENRKKIISYWESIQSTSAMKNWMIIDLKSVLSSVNNSLDNAENKIWNSVQKVIFWINADCNTFYQKSFRWYLQTIIDEIWWKSLWFYSLPRIYSCVINSKKNYLLIDIWANITSIILVKDWLFKKSESFPIWSSIFTKRISKLFALSYDEADKIKILYSLWKWINYKISNNDFQQDIDLWLTAFYISIKNFSEENLPNIILLTWWWSLFPLIKDTLRNNSFPFKKLKFIDKPIVEHLEFEQLRINKFKRDDQTIPWTPVCMLWAFATS